ncbi:hypothetical protein LEP1GSC172_2280 [Leptospira noguchii]|uniref:Uncharacterized protein n=1 Tax=Leptospira noguchii TaxID=28182 RepID=M6VQ62_9LEPT|nr:hypothetical protein LEP1GSC172_2280 [Leptospira noguchii]
MKINFSITLFMNFEISFLSVDYLKNINTKQKLLIRDLEKHLILKKFRNLNPLSPEPFLLI